MVLFQIADLAGVCCSEALASALGSAAPGAGPGPRTLEAVAAAWQSVSAFDHPAAVGSLAYHTSPQAAEAQHRRGASDPGTPLHLLGSPQWSGSSADQVSSCFGGLH